MPIADWHPSYETGLASIDAQHHCLFDAVNALAAAHAGGLPVDQVQRVMDALIDTTVAHFRSEADLLHRYGFPGFAAHAGEHARLAGELQRLRATLESGRPIALEVAQFLTDWLKFHILEADMAYAPFLKAHSLA
jgi:hemerythrin-like metal-binding protein